MTKDKAKFMVHNNQPAKPPAGGAGESNGRGKTCFSVQKGGKHSSGNIWWNKDYPNLRNYWGCVVCGIPLKKEGKK